MCLHFEQVWLGKMSDTGLPDFQETRTIDKDWDRERLGDVETWRIDESSDQDWDVGGAMTEDIDMSMCDKQV